MSMSNFIEIFEKVASIGDIVKGITGFLSFQVIWVFFRDWRPKKVQLSIGSFRVKRKYFNVQTVTNIVSAKYYDGGQVPADVRREIILLTSPKVSEISIDLSKK